MTMRLRLIGYWTTGPGDTRDLPDPYDFVDPNWDEDARHAVEAYLSQGTYLRGFMGLSPCRMCGTSNGSGELTDGVLAWPEGLVHYVRDHNVRLPPAVEAYIQRRMEELDNAEVDHSWWAAGAPKPLSVGDLPLDPIRRLAWRGNAQLLHDSGRRFPGLFVQGDTLSSHVDGAQSAELLGWYEEMMRAGGHPLPYPKERHERA